MAPSSSQGDPLATSFHLVAQLPGKALYGALLPLLLFSNYQGPRNMEKHQRTNVDSLAHEIAEKYGLLLDQKQLASLLGRSTSGLRYSFAYPRDESTRSLKQVGRRIGKRIYYPATEVARVLYQEGAEK